MWSSSLSTPLRHVVGVEVYLHSFFTSALDWGEWSTLRLGRFIPPPDRPPLRSDEAGWTPELFWTRWRREITVAGLEPRTVQLVAVTIPTTIPRPSSMEVGYVGSWVLKGMRCVLCLRYSFVIWCGGSDNVRITRWWRTSGSTFELGVYKIRHGIWCLNFLYVLFLVLLPLSCLCPKTVEQRHIADSSCQTSVN
jgi:hypothetical protein